MIASATLTLPAVWTSIFLIGDIAYTPYLHKWKQEYAELGAYHANSGYKPNHVCTCRSHRLSHCRLHQNLWLYSEPASMSREITPRAMTVPLLTIAFILAALSVARMVVDWRDKETVICTKTTKTLKSIDDTEY